MTHLRLRLRIHIALYWRLPCIQCSWHLSKGVDDGCGPTVYNQPEAAISKI